MASYDLTLSHEFCDETRREKSRAEQLMHLIETSSQMTSTHAYTFGHDPSTRPLKSHFALNVRKATMSRQPCADENQSGENDFCGILYRPSFYTF
jgi:hypothetical protein